MRRKLIIFFISLTVLSLQLLYIWKEQKVDTARAYGHLIVDTGVPSGDPIFVISNFLPGDCEVRNISVTNDDTIPIELAVRSDNESQTQNLPDVLHITITGNSSVLYSESLAQFFIDSDSLDGTPLSTLNDGDTTSFEYKICFEENAGNQYQNAQTIFDLIFGEVISPLTLPAECSHLQGIITQKIEGTEGRDDIRGTNENELIIGYGGNDELDGASGTDCVVGGDGNDELDGGSQEDVVIGGNGNDEIDGGSEDDIIYGNAGKDEIKGGSGNDKIYGGSEDDEIDGQSGNDEIYGEQGNDDIEGGSGNDYLNGGPGHDKLNGKSGNDTCIEGEELTLCEL